MTEKNIDAEINKIAHQINILHEKAYREYLGLVDVDELPEFIPVVAKDGTTGYIKTKDVIKIPKTIEEALKMTENAYADQVLPLYNRDGEVIGEIVNSYGDTEEMGLEFKASSSD